jgi:hypothetical protein
MSKAEVILQVAPPSGDECLEPWELRRGIPLAIFPLRGRASLGSSPSDGSKAVFLEFVKGSLVSLGLWIPVLFLGGLLLMGLCYVFLGSSEKI